MDRLRKRLEAFRLKVRGFIDHNWHNEPEGDKFRSLDKMFVLGAVRYKPTTKWQRICWNAYRVVPVFNFLMFVLNAMDEISGKFDLIQATWHASLVFVAGLCFVKDLILNQRFESIQAARSFIDSKPFGSGDPLADSARRKKYFQRLQLTALLIFVMLLTDQIIFIFPNSGIDQLFGAPWILLRFDLAIAGIIHFLFLSTVSPVWVNKYSAGTGTICSLLYGFNIEYEIYVHGFENILDNVYLDIEEGLPRTIKAPPEWIRYQRDHLYWKYLEQRIIEQVKLHVQLVKYDKEYLTHSSVPNVGTDKQLCDERRFNNPMFVFHFRNLQVLQPVVKNLFGIIYYNAMVLFSPFIFVLWRNGLSVTSISLVLAIVLNLIECYGWCCIVESFTDTNETLELEIMDLMTKIPYSQFHRKKYVELRTTLCIMKTFVRNHQPFSCGGVFPITVEAFRELLDVGYTVFTFLRDFAKKG